MIFHIPPEDPPACPKCAAKAALLRELAARLPDLLSPHGICQLCGAEGGHQPDCLLRRVDAEAGEEQER